VLTGDSRDRAERAGEALGVPVVAGLLPTDKVKRIEAARTPKRAVVMVGDGLNDAPVLASADVGIALAAGADLARDAADVVLLNEGASTLRALPFLVQLSRRTVRRIRWNLVWAFGYNSAGMLLAAVGFVHPVLAALLMVASSLLVVAGSLRAVARAPRRPAPDAAQHGESGRAPCGGAPEFPAARARGSAKEAALAP
jgi:P-type E1-E2 ATPase